MHKDDEYRDNAAENLVMTSNLHAGLVNEVSAIINSYSEVFSCGNAFEVALIKLLPKV